MPVLRAFLRSGLLLVGLAAGCAAERAPRVASAAQSAAGSELRPTDAIPALAERPPNVRAPDPIAARDARAPDLAVQLIAPERVGAIHEEHRDALGLALEVENDSTEPVAISPASALVEVYRDGELLEGCAAATPLKLPHALAPRVVHRAELQMPCPLIDDGEYAIVSTLIVGDEDPGVSATRRADQAELIVDAALPPVGSTSMPIADVHAPPVSGSEVPGSADRLPEESGPSGPSRPAVP